MDQGTAAQAKREARMVTGLLDSNIVVDLLREREVARAWVAEQGRLGITRAVWLEVIEGARDSVGLRRALALLNEFELVEFTVSDFDWATQQIIRYRLSHNVDAFDCLIAAPSYRLQLPLYTRNVKHFVPLLGKLAQAPYG